MKGKAPFPWNETWEIRYAGTWTVIITNTYSGDMQIATGFKNYGDACEYLADIYY